MSLRPSHSFNANSEKKNISLRASHSFNTNKKNWRHLKFFNNSSSNLPISNCQNDQKPIPERDVVVDNLPEIRDYS